MEVGGEQAETVLSSVDGFGSGLDDTEDDLPDCRYEQFCRAPGLLTLPGRPRVIGREIRTALNKEQREAPFHGTITRLWPTSVYQYGSRP